MANRARGWPAPEYRVSAVFRAPMPYVFSWCTDFDPDDAPREGEDYARKIVERSRRRVVYEDLFDSDDGWNWSRQVVTLRPPSRWHCDSVGSHRDAKLDYVLTALSGDRTRLDLRWRRRPTGLASTRRSKRAIEKATTQAWCNFAASLEKDYRTSRPRKRR